MGAVGLELPLFIAFSSILAAAASLIVFAAAFVAAQPFFDMTGGLIGAFVGVDRRALRLKQCARIEMQHAFGAKSKAIAADCCVAGIAAAKIFRCRFRDAVCDSLLER